MEQDRCHTVDFDLFLSLWNETQNYKTPAIQYRIAIWLQRCWARGRTRLLLQAFRGSGKSTLAATFCAWLLLRDPDLRILVLSAESMLAEKMVRQVRKTIEKHPLTTSLRPTNADQWAADRFTVERPRVSRDPSVLARGIHANITGARADFIICDDVEVPNTADTADKRARLRTRLAENRFILTPGGTQLYIGTPHSYYSLYAQKARTEIGEERAFLESYYRLTIPLVGPDGHSHWPERFPDTHVDEIRRDCGPLQFAAQMMLEPVNIARSRFDVSLLQRYGEDIVSSEAQKMLILKLCGKKLLSVSAWWDPSFGSESGDGSVLAIVFTDEDGHRWLHRVDYIRVTARAGEDEATLQCRAVAKRVREFFLPMVHVEGNGIGKFLPAILRNVLAEENLNCAVIEKHTVKSKTTRILESFDAVMAARALHVHASVYDTPFITEMTEWKPLASGMRDDGLDAAAGAMDIEPVRLPRRYAATTRLWSASGSGHAAVTDFDV